MSGQQILCSRSGFLFCPFFASSKYFFFLCTSPCGLALALGQARRSSKDASMPAMRLSRFPASRLNNSFSQFSVSVLAVKHFAPQRQSQTFCFGSALRPFLPGTTLRRGDGVPPPPLPVYSAYSPPPLPCFHAFLEIVCVISRLCARVCDASFETATHFKTAILFFMFPAVSGRVHCCQHADGCCKRRRRKPTCLLPSSSNSSPLSFFVFFSAASYSVSRFAAPPGDVPRSSIMNVLVHR